MAAKTVATLTNTHAREWTVTAEGTGIVLAKLVGAEGHVLGVAAASMVADHGYPAGGVWVHRGPGEYSYTVDGQPAGSSGTSSAA